GAGILFVSRLAHTYTASFQRFKQRSQIADLAKAAHAVAFELGAQEILIADFLFCIEGDAKPVTWLMSNESTLLKQEQSFARRRPAYTIASLEFLLTHRLSRLECTVDNQFANLRTQKIRNRAWNVPVARCHKHFLSTTSGSSS